MLWWHVLLRHKLLRQCLHVLLLLLVRMLVLLLLLLVGHDCRPNHHWQAVLQAGQLVPQTVHLSVQSIKIFGERLCLDVDAIQNASLGTCQIIGMHHFLVKHGDRLLHIV